VALALLDLYLPGGLSGLDLLAQWLQEGRRVPAILITGYPDQAVVIRALRLGIRDFVPKSPDFIEYLPTAVDRVMSEIQVERKLAESELRLASVIGTTLDAIVMAEASGRILLSNESAQRLFGYSTAEMTERVVKSLIPDLDLGTAVPAGGFRLRQELEAVAGPTGDRIPIEVAVSDVVIHGERFFTVIARDITERRRVEEERREADRRKDEFLGMLGHELRNPLSAIMSAGEVMKQRVDDPQLKKIVEVVRRQTRALSRMVDDLLDVSRVTLGKIELRREPMLLCTAVTRAVDTVGEAAKRAGLRLDADVSDVDVWVHADPTRLEQVLVNLLNNAIKFTPPGGQVSLACAQEGDEAVVTVRDTGLGMPASLVPHVFELFVQGDRSLDRSRSGLGIGLSLVQRIVTMHGGSVTAHSAGPGEGSTFTVRLPVAPPRADSLDGLGREPAAAMPRLRVLVVDDQQDVADMVAVLVDALGHDVSTVYDAGTALEMAGRDAFDVIITDLGMPDLSGYELAERVRRDPRLRNLRLVALTGYGRPEDEARVAAAGFDVHLTKPVTDTALQEALSGMTAGQLRTV
jgi:PAS domain S-box-containing protein